MILSNLATSHLSKGVRGLGSSPIKGVIKRLQDNVSELDDLVGQGKHVTLDEQRALRNICSYLGSIERGINDG